jgi:N-methylhydantoinase A
MRYQGQGHEIEVTLPAVGRRRYGLAALFADLPRLFAAAYAETYLVSFLGGAGRDHQLEGRGRLARPPTSPPATAWATRRRANAKAPSRASGRIYLGETGGYADVPVYDRYAAGAGTIADRPRRGRGARIDLHHRQRRPGVRSTAITTSSPSLAR